MQKKSGNRILPDFFSCLFLKNPPRQKTKNAGESQKLISGGIENNDVLSDYFPAAIAA